MASSPTTSVYPSLSRPSLLIATPNAIILHSQNVNETLLECDTADGIVHTRVSRGKRNLIAVSSSHSVLLCDTARIRNRKRKLSTGHVGSTLSLGHTSGLTTQGQPLLLLFSPDSSLLYFTTSLNTCVQVYHIPTAALLPPLGAHPSPPNVIAISNDGCVLLSASPAPLVVYLHDRRFGGNGHVQLSPTDTGAAITCAAFRVPSDIPGSSNTRFLLGFQDGTVAVYRMLVPPLPHYSEGGHPEGLQSIQFRPIRVSAVKNLHKAAMGGCTAAEFVPNYRSRIISTGRDGRCRLVDYGDGGTILRT